ncbi:hypothetical protein OPV22_005940 [Ensete ventricosum]|uniref:E2F transcription factor CC-MB domain-containing protein n=1 Tax=Ensete ventricosum TaxID=4639 RepID=A0AAV8RRW9_ENSVE|nr:hypothetical protein OPV22_005940 [Ensete ventricosum]
MSNVGAQVDVENFALQECGFDDCIRLLYVTEDDIKAPSCFQDETLIAIKAPHSTLRWVTICRDIGLS